MAPGKSGWTLWLLDLTTGDTRATGLSRVIFFDWYRDARRVLYLKSPKEYGPVMFLAADLQTGRESEVLTMPIAEIDVRRDGGAVAFIKAASHFGMNLYSLPLDIDPTTNLPQPAGEPQALTAGQGLWHAHGGGWAPDGNGLVYTRDLDHGDLYTIDMKFDRP